MEAELKVVTIYTKRIKKNIQGNKAPHLFLVLTISDF